MGGWDADVSLVYGSNEVAYGVENSLNTSYGAASQTEFDAGAMKYDQLVFNAGIVRTFEVGGLPEGINVAFGIEARQRGLFDRSGRTRLLRPRAHRRCARGCARISRASSPATRSTRTARRTASTRISSRGSRRNSWHRSRCAPSTIRTSVRRHRQGRRPLRLHRLLRAARRRVHGLPRAGTAAGVLHLHRHQLHQRRAVRSGHVPGHVGRGDHARRATARRRGVRQLLAGHGVPLRRLRSHHRRLSHRHRRSHRAVGEPAIRRRSPR